MNIQTTIAQLILSITDRLACSTSHKCRLLRMTVVSMLLLSGIGLSAQQLTPFVLSTSGGYYSNAQGSLSFTTGEMAAIETLSSPNIILTQGFQQTFDVSTSVSDPGNSSFLFNVYPNPSGGSFNLVTETEINTHFDVRIVDLLGREVTRTEFYQQDKTHIQPFHLSIPAGTYFMMLHVRGDHTDPISQLVKKIQIFQ